MTYPGEFHYFTREHVLRDAWTRVDSVLRQVAEAGDTPAIVTAMQDDTPVVVSAPVVHDPLGDEVVMPGAR